MASTNPVSSVYRSVVDDVISNVREAFLDEGVDEQVLQELKQLWESKLMQTRALDSVVPDAQEQVALPATIQYAQFTTPQQSTQQHTVRTQGVTQTVPVPVQIAAGGSNEISASAATAAMALPQGLFQQQLQALAAQGLTVQPTGNGQFIIQAISQPQTTQIAPTISVQQQQGSQTTIPTVVQGQVQINPNILQIDGANDTSSSEEEDFDNDDDDDENEDDQKDDDNDDPGEEEEPLNSEDDVSDEDPIELFDTENVVVCQYDKSQSSSSCSLKPPFILSSPPQNAQINRNKNKWKFHLKDGIMNLNGKDYVFQKATGDAEW